MRRSHAIAATATLAALGLAAAIFLLRNPSRPRRPGTVSVGPDQPVAVVDPGSIMSRGPAPVLGGAGTPGNPADPDDPAVSSDPRGRSGGSSAPASPATPPADPDTLPLSALADLAIQAGDAPIPGAGPGSAASPPRRAAYPAWRQGTARIEEAQPVTERAGYTDPVWSPIGLDIAFTRADASGLWIAPPDPAAAGATTPRARLLADDPGCGRGFAWNIDGMSIRARAGDGGWMDVLVTGERYPAPPPARAVYERGGAIFATALAAATATAAPGAPATPAADNAPVRVSGPEDRFRDPVLSPDGTLVAYVGVETGVYISPVDPARGPILAVGPGDHPAWLPDSTGLLFDRIVDDPSALETAAAPAATAGQPAAPASLRGPADGELWFAGADGRERTNLTETPGVAESHPRVAIDGRRIAFASGGAIFTGKFRRNAPPAAPPPPAPR